MQLVTAGRTPSIKTIVFLALTVDTKGTDKIIYMSIYKQKGARCTFILEHRLNLKRT
jgi:hypothetical protein